MRIKIVSDGTSTGTKIINAETGEFIENCVVVEWRIQADQPAEVILKVSGADVSISGTKKSKKRSLKK